MDKKIDKWADHKSTFVSNFSKYPLLFPWVKNSTDIEKCKNPFFSFPTFALSFFLQFARFSSGKFDFSSALSRKTAYYKMWEGSAEIVQARMSKKRHSERKNCITKAGNKKMDKEKSV